MLNIRNQRGETLVEVVLGLSILTFVLLGSYILTNQATRITQEANERTEVSNYMRQQIEILTAAKEDSVNNGSSSQWGDVIGSRVSSTGSYNAGCEAQPGPDGEIAVVSANASNPFVLNPGNNFAVTNAFNLDQVQTGNYFEDGKYTIWTEAYSPSSSNYVDVYITACWEKIGGGAIERTGLVRRFNV